MKFIYGHQLRCCSTGHRARLNFVNWYLHGVSDGGIDPMLVLFSEEAGHNLSGCVNSQHNRCWSAVCPILLGRVPLHDIKVGVWSAARIIGAIFFFTMIVSHIVMLHCDAATKTSD
jgi:hypothetical protein